MGQALLSIDWDFFIPTMREWNRSYIENKKNIKDIWYKRYIQSKSYGVNLENLVNKIYPTLNQFKTIIKNKFLINSKTKLFVSDSHKYSYNIAKKFNYKNVFSFDAHSDLGYGGLKSLDFEINCANWLGMLLKENLIDEANIIYSKFSYEYANEFAQMNKIYRINYPKINNLQDAIQVDAIHICRSGCWTPPWLDYKFKELINTFNKPYKIIDYKDRNWDIKNLTLADEINYMIG